MYINRALLLAVGVFLVFSPAMGEWIFNQGIVWHRPYQLWLLIVVAAYWNQRTRYPDEL